jgi:hypothetical protein
METKTAMQELIDFINSENFNSLYPSIKEEWFKHFLDKDKYQRDKLQSTAYLDACDNYLKH